MAGKVDFAGPRVLVPCDVAFQLASGILRKSGCAKATAETVARHLLDAELCGVESHGLVRVLNYTEQFASGYMSPRARPRVVDGKGGKSVDGRRGIGIPAMRLAVEAACEAARQAGIAALPVRNVGHTGRLGAFAETAAEAGFLVIIIGGGGRQNWRQVAPYGGRKALLPTNPYAIGIPGGCRGPIVIDFATSMIAGGWLYSARAAGGLVPEGCIIDKQGRPTRDPSDYFAGGAILPKGGPMGYGLAVMAEMICEAMLGPVTTESNWLVIALHAGRYREEGAFKAAAEEILSELRQCPPAPGHERVEAPGERERSRRHQSLERGGVSLPERTLEVIQSLAGATRAQVPISKRPLRNRSS